MMDRYLAGETPEAQAYTHVTENAHWDSDPSHPLHVHSLPASAETNIALFASYKSFLRYVAGEDLYVPPRNVSDLRLTLNRYAHDAIHNIIAHSRVPLASGGYRRVCARAERSIKMVLLNQDNVMSLLDMHHRDVEEKDRYDQPEQQEVFVLPTVASL